MNEPLEAAWEHPEAMEGVDSPSPLRRGAGDGGDGPEEDLVSRGMVFVAEDPAMWESEPLQAGIVIEFLVSEDTETGLEEACVAVFVKEVDIGLTGAFLGVKAMGASSDWGRNWGIRSFSQGKLKVHICRDGVKRCAGKDIPKCYHVGTCTIFLRGEPPPDYVDKAKRRDWKKWLEELRKAEKQLKAPKGAEAFPRRRGAGEAKPGGGKDAEVAPRVAALKAKLQKAKEKVEPPFPPLPPPPAQEESRLWEVSRPGPSRPPDFPVKQERVVGLTQSPERSRREKGRGGVSGALAQAAVEHQEEEKRRKRSKDRRKSKKRKKSREKSRGRSRKRRKDSKSSRDKSASSSSSDLLPPLQRKAEKKPGSVLKLLLDNARDSLAQASVVDKEDGVLGQHSGNIMASYFQIIAKPQLGNKVRDSRELETLARVLDLLRGGHLAELGDTVAGRFMAVESAGLTNNWTDARHLEVLPVRQTGLAPAQVLLKAQRHSRQVEKAAGRGSWARNTWSSNNWRNQNEEKTSGKGKDKPKGKGGGKKGGKQQQSNAWKDKPKEGEGATPAS